MTPSAITPEGRNPKRDARPGAQSAPGRRAQGPRAGAQRAPWRRAQGHPRELPRQPAPAVPRRVSGPRGGRDRPRARDPELRFARLRRRNLRAPIAPLGARASAFVRTLPDHALLDRIVRGRAWIPLLGVMLAGIVAMQVEVLGLGASMGRAIERSTALQSRNEALRASVASLTDQQRIERLAAGMGMVMPAPGSVGFLAAQPGASAQDAAASIHPPAHAAFAAALPGAAATGAGGAASTAGTSATPPASTAGTRATPAATAGGG